MDSHNKLCNYYAWGETSPKSAYSSANSTTYGKTMGDIGGNVSYDAARANWGGSWRLPTSSEFDELLAKCIWTWTSQGGHNGYLVKGPNGYVSLHRRIFEGVFEFAGSIRDYDIAKSEWVLDGDTVNYLNWEDLRRAIDYDLEQERDFSYVGLSADDVVRHITRFVSNLWQIHAFREGNTRTTAVFTIQYLRSIGFDVSNNLFAEHSWYFRNALVRANYKNVRKGIDYTPVCLERFFRNLLWNEDRVLRNRCLHINASGEWSEQPRADRTSAGQAESQGIAVTPAMERLLMAVGEDRLPTKAIMAKMQLGGRDNFLNLYLKPAMALGLVTMQFPNSPRHSGQTYFLTAKGLSLLEKISGGGE